MPTAAFVADGRAMRASDATGATLLTAGYQGDGLRAWKANGSGQKTYFVYDGDDPVIERDANGTVTAINRFGPEGLLARQERQSDGTYAETSYQFDPQGNVAIRRDANGRMVGCDLYAAYGALATALDAAMQPTTPTGPWGYEAQFGYYTDRETGLLLLGSRYYDPQAGRFVTRDPIGAEGGANLYAYADGDPVNEVDPEGTGPKPTDLGSFGRRPTTGAESSIDSSWGILTRT